MMYKIFARKDNKAFCYAVDNVEETTNGYYFRDIKIMRLWLLKRSDCGNPTFTGREFHGYKEIVLA